MKKQVSDKLDKIADKINTAAVIVFILGGLFGLGYGAVKGIGGAFGKRIENKTVPTSGKSMPRDTIDYVSAMKKIDSIKER